MDHNIPLEIAFVQSEAMEPNVYAVNTEYIKL